MWKAIVAGTAALAIAGSSLVYAQQRGRDEGGMRGWRPNVEDMRAFGEARLAALKAGLMLTADQEKSWPAFEQAARDFGKLRLDRREAMRNAAPNDDPVERLRQRATALSDTGAALKRLADATDPLYKSLDESQKRRFQMLSRFAGPGREGSGREHRWELFRERSGGREGGREGWFHRGPQRTDDGSGDMDGTGGERL